MIDPTVWDSIILKITAEQYHFLNRELEITKTNLKLPSLQDVSELIDDLASIAFYEFNNVHQRTERADLALNLVWLFTEQSPKGLSAIHSFPLKATRIISMITIIMRIIMIV